MSDSDQPRVDDSYLDGTYLDLTTGECYQIDRDETTGEAILLDMDGDEAERLTPGDWVANQEDFVPIPQEAVRDPVNYYETKVDQLRQLDKKLDAGFIYARQMTEVVEHD